MVGMVAVLEIRPDGWGKEEGMYTMECACGERLEAEDDQALFERVREHMDREHPEKGVEDHQVRNLIEAAALDAGAEERTQGSRADRPAVPREEEST